MIELCFPELKLHHLWERGVWISYLLIVLISSLIGDTIILSAVRHNAIKLNGCLVGVMEQIAVCDLIQALTLVLPTTVSLLANRWDISGVFPSFVF